MNLNEETFGATLDSNGQLHFSQQTQLPPGPAQVTVRVAGVAHPRRGLADVIREIAAEQRARGFPGRSPAELQADDDARHAEDDERDREQNAARQSSAVGGP